MASQIKTEQEMFPLVENWLQSGLTQKQFCLNHGLPIHILAYWVGRHRQSQPAKATADKVATSNREASKKIMVPATTHGFIRLSPPPASPPPTSTASPTTPTGHMEVALPSGAVIRFSTTVPACYLKELLSVCSH
jgi:transposase